MLPWGDMQRLGIQQYLRLGLDHQQNTGSSHINYPLAMTNSLLLNMAIYSGFSHLTLTCSIAMLAITRGYTGWWCNNHLE